MKKIGAFFDIDGTLYRNSLLIEHFNKLIQYEMIDERVWFDRIEVPFTEWTERKGDYEYYTYVVAEAYRNALVGFNLDEIEFLAKHVIKKNWQKTYVYTRNQIKWHQEHGHEVIFISGSPDFLVGKMADAYGVKVYKASTYVKDEGGIFHGEVLPMWDSESKKRAVMELRETFDIDLKESYAYGDTGGDYTLLELVGNPVAINPNRNLFLRIKESVDMLEKVKIVVERKDMIYEIDPKTIKIL
ncbi:HAD family hydrolase [Guggenheimella bovis]